MFNPWLFVTYNKYSKLESRQMNEVITILTPRSGNQIAKAFVGLEFVQQRFSIGRSFTAYEEQVSDLMSLSRLLQKFENEPTKTIIRGALVDGQRGPVSRNKETFTATPRQWCMIDIDSLAWDRDSRDQQAMLSYATQQLPVEFQSVDFWYQFSSSMGVRRMIEYFVLHKNVNEQSIMRRLL